MKFFPLIYEPEKSNEVLKQTQIFIDNNPEIELKINKLFWSYHSIFNIIPTTTESFWSGHNFPYNESWDEIQISFNLVCFGLYKQAMTSLRSALELGLLSVYYNINDDGHNAVKKWLSSSDSKESDTPKTQEIWKIISQNQNINNFQKNFDIRQDLIDLNYLHNFVHTKGHKFSNNLGKMKSNFQTFEKDFIEIWLNSLEKIVVIILTLHLLKFPSSLLDYDYGKKFGIDIPSFSHLSNFEIERIRDFFPADYFSKLQEICLSDEETINFREWLESYDDMSEDDVENQIIELDKHQIQQQGIKKYKKQQLKIYNVRKFADLSSRIQNRINILEKWARKNNFIEPKWKK